MRIWVSSMRQAAFRVPLAVPWPLDVLDGMSFSAWIIAEVTIFNKCCSSTSIFITLVDMLQGRNNDRLRVCHG